MLAADFLNLGKDVEMVNDHADLFHLDIMDGTFVPNISYGFPIVDAIAKKSRKPLDAHLMIVNPENYVEKFAKSGVDMLSFHLNATSDPANVLVKVRESGMKAGLAINPDIPVESLFPYLELCDFVVIMSVFAGFGGQKFIEDTYNRVRIIKTEIDRRSLQVKIQVDGGVSPGNAKALAEAGADILVAGSAVFRAEDPATVINAIRG